MNQISITYVENGLHFNLYVELEEGYKKAPLNGFNKWIESLKVERKCIEALAESHSMGTKYCCLGVASKMQRRLKYENGYSDNDPEKGMSSNGGLTVHNPLFTAEYRDRLDKDAKYISFLALPSGAEVMVNDSASANNKFIEEYAFDPMQSMAGVNDAIDCEFFDPIIFILELIFCDSTKTK